MNALNRMGGKSRCVATVVAVALGASLFASRASAWDDSYCPPLPAANPFVSNTCICFGNLNHDCDLPNCCDGNCTFNFQNTFPTCAEMAVCWDLQQPPGVGFPTEQILVNGVLIDQFYGSSRCLGGDSGRKGICIAPNGITTVTFRNITDPGIQGDACVGMGVEFAAAQTLPGPTNHFLWSYVSSSPIEPAPLHGQPPATGFTAVHQVNCGPAPATVQLSTSRTANSGGHLHGGDALPDSTGHFQPNAVNLVIGPTGTATIMYQAGIYAREEKPKATCAPPTCDPLIAAESKLEVKFPGLVQLAEDGHFQLVGCTASHPSNHFVAPDVAVLFAQAAQDYFTLFPNSLMIHVNDCSIQWGGKFDCDMPGDLANFGPDQNNPNAALYNPHEEHRSGRTQDIRDDTGGEGDWTGAGCEAARFNFDARFAADWRVMPAADARCCPGGVGNCACPYRREWRRIARDHQDTRRITATTFM